MSFVFSQAKRSLSPARARDQSYQLAKTFEPYFADAFLKMQRGMIDDQTAHAFESRWNSGSTLSTIMETLPFYSKTAQDAVWVRFTGMLVMAYHRVVLAAGMASMEQLNKQLGTQFGFTMNDVGKARTKKPKYFKPKQPFVSAPVVPVNTYSLKWINAQATKLIKESFTDEQRKVVKKIIEDGFSKGLRGPIVLKNIRDNIGLTERAYNAVEHRRGYLIKEGVSSERIEDQIDKYRDSLLMQRAVLISRTETIMAEAAGRNQAWQLAQDSGILPEVERVWISAPESPRLCEHCEALDGTTAAIGEEYEPGVMMPTLHPNCRCTEILRPVNEENE